MPIKASRRRRIALGSGTTPADVNRLLKQFAEMQKLMSCLARAACRGCPVGCEGCSGASPATALPRHRADPRSSRWRGGRDRRLPVFLGGATTDRAAHAGAGRQPSRTSSVYLQPSTGQQAQSASVLSRLPPASRTALPPSTRRSMSSQQRFLGQAGIDYRADVKPCFGVTCRGRGVGHGRRGAADRPSSSWLGTSRTRRPQPRAHRRLCRGGVRHDRFMTTYQGVSVRTGTDATYAIVSGMMVFSVRTRRRSSTTSSTPPMGR